MTKAYEKAKAWRAKNHDKWLLACKEYRGRHPDVLRASKKRYYKKHKEVKKKERLDRRLKIIIFIDEHKASVGCVFCRCE